MKNIACTLYPESRHELINDLDKEQVMEDIRNWCDKIEKLH